MNIRLRVGQVWESDTGTRFKIVAIRPGAEGLCDLVEVRRLNAPHWDDGKYTWAADSFALPSMKLCPGVR